jgi:hypothetical protein
LLGLAWPGKKANAQLLIDHSGQHGTLPLALHSIYTVHGHLVFM